MKLINTAWQVYHRVGFWGLIKRIKEYIYWNLNNLMILLFSGKGDVLFVSGCPGGSRMYRCENQAEKLKRAGLKAMVVDQNSSALFFLIKKFRIFIFQRVIYNQQIARVVAEIKTQKKEIIFETDDLVFDPSFIPYMNYFNHMGAEEKSWYANGIGREILEDDYVKRCIVSTDYLAEKIKEKYPKKEVLVSYNSLSEKQIKWAEKVLKRKSKIKPKDGKVRIGYFSGSKSHDADFETVASVIRELLEENKNLILMVVGPLKLGEDFSGFSDQIERFDFVSIKKLPELILRCDINIAPLEIDNPFCQAKSGLKFFEAGILGIPTVATATDSFCRMIKNGQTGFCVKNLVEWKEVLKKLIDEKELRKKVGLAARCLVKEKWVGGKFYL